MSILVTCLKKIGDVMLGEFKMTMIDRLFRVETKIDSIETDVGEIKQDVKSLQNRTGRLETVTVEIQRVLLRSGAQLNQPLLISPGSPLKLTPAGEELAQKIDGYNFIEKNKEFFFALIDTTNPTSAYDVQAAANKVLADSVAHPNLNPIKKYAYDSGSNIEPLLSVLGIILRDKYLSAHPSITSV